MKNNPFVTVILIICIEITLYNYIDYNDLILPSSEYADLVLPIFMFIIPIISFFILVFIKDLEHRKEFRKFTIFLFIGSFILFMALSYLTALAGAYRH